MIFHYSHIRNHSNFTLCCLANLVPLFSMLLFFFSLVWPRIIEIVHHDEKPAIMFMMLKCLYAINKIQTRVH